MPRTRNWIRKIVYLLVAIGFSCANAGSYEEFFEAIVRDDPVTVGRLAQRGVDPNSRDPKGQTALFVALQRDSLKAADALLASATPDLNLLNDTGESALMMAALKGHAEWVRKLIERGAQVNKTGWTPLHYAATGPNPAVVQLLLDKGAAVDAESPNRTTPLMMAARYGSEAGVDVLLARGADPKRTNDLGLSAADFARDAQRTALSARLAKLMR